MSSHQIRGLLFAVLIVLAGVFGVAAIIHDEEAKQCHDRGGVLVRYICFDPKVLR